MTLYKFDDEWTLEINIIHIIPIHSSLYLYHTPPNGQCHLGGRWVTKPDHPKRDACNCDVKIPKKLWLKILILRLAMSKKLKL